MANENKYYKTPFAESGNKAEVPNVSTGGSVGYDSGFGPDYELPQGTVNRKRIERNLYNGMHNGITKNLKQWQEHLYPTWIEDDGAGAAYSYPVGMIVNHDGQSWASNEASNQEEPGAGTKWDAFAPLRHDLMTEESLNAVGGHDAIYSRVNQSLSTALSYVNPASIVGSLLQTASRYSQAECASFGISYPDGGGARYLVVAAAGQIIDNIKFQVMTNTGFLLELIDTPTVNIAGIVANYVSAANKGFNNYTLITALDALNLAEGNANILPSGKYYSSLPLTLNSDTKGSKNTVFYVDSPATLGPLVNIGVGAIAKRITVRPSATNATKTFMANEFDALFGTGFDYHLTAGGLQPLGDNVVMDCKALGMARGARGGGNDITYVRGKYEGADWGASIYAAKRITFSGTLIIGGSVGGMGMPSCQNVTVCNGATVYNPDGTGINTGGSSAAGLNAKDINVVGVNVYARDCINLENGCVGANISGYNCHVITLNSANGVGVGVFSRAADGGGHVSDVCIGKGKIRGQNGVSYAYAVRVGFEGVAISAQSVSDISISGVHATQCRVGVQLDSPSTTSMSRLELSNNNMFCIQRGYQLPAKLVNSNISGGNINRDALTTISGTAGIRMFIMDKVAINGVGTKGFFPHYEQQGLVTRSKLIEPIANAGEDNANFTLLSNLSGGTAIPITYAVV